MYRIVITVLLLTIVALLINPSSSEPDLSKYACGQMTKHAAVTCLVNEFRVAHGLQKLSGNQALHESARIEALRVFRCGHTHFPCGVSWIKSLTAAGVTCDGAWSAAENLAWTFTEPSQVVSAWEASPPHRAIMLGAYREIGVAYRLGQWVMHLYSCT